MASLTSISGIDKTSLELLEVAGFHNTQSLATAEVQAVARELSQANAICKISKCDPSHATIAQWIDEARDLVGDEPESASPASTPVNYEQSPQVIELLANAPFAIPLPARLLVEHELGVGDIPAAILLNRYAGDLDVKVASQSEKCWLDQVGDFAAGSVRVMEPGQSRLGIDLTKLRSTEKLGEPTPRVVDHAPTPDNDRVALLRAPRVATNKGRDPQSRWYIRGVLHSHPLSVFFGALVTLILMIVTPAFVISGALLLASGEMPNHFAWVPKWLLVFPLLWPIIGLVYLIWGVGASCRICGQKLFVHRPHLKNSRAHHLPGLGYILPLCLHLLCFRWFRCTHCGTPVRLKE